MTLWLVAVCLIPSRDREGAVLGLRELATRCCRCLRLLVPLSPIHRYSSIANKSRSCSGIGVLKESNKHRPRFRHCFERRLRNCKMEGGNSKMEYRRLPLSCECGGVPKNISAVGFSSTHDLVIHWRCPRCHKNLCVVKPLSDCWRDCLPEVSGHTPTPTAPLTVDTPEDRRFLHRVGVRYLDE